MQYGFKDLESRFLFQSVWVGPALHFTLPMKNRDRVRSDQVYLIRAGAAIYGLIASVFNEKGFPCFKCIHGK
ncbi:hypothetical protein DRW42_26845 [Pedobacter miscanthi]|uniref:Uncharacterized protein n=1 Tax=Pedobacter miscanthi TaxID=2259170 RepID=A0A366KL23_9SPHI|nr:hypothetical protein DRW42_26845 [Pedobacter miscanthi]